MSTRDDPLTQALTSEQTRDRLYYRLGVLLDADDLSTEQLYHRGRLARALSFLHGSGTVAGLRVGYKAAQPAQGPNVPATEEELTVEGGLALDSFGRLIEVPRSACIRLDRWFLDQDPAELAQAVHDVSVLNGVMVRGVVADVYLRFAACERGKTPALATGPFDATDAVAPSRLRDGYELKLVLATGMLSPPPASLWPGSGTSSLSLEDAQKAILDAWDSQPRWPDLAGLVPGLEDGQLIPLRRDPSAVFIARVAIPVSGPPIRRQRSSADPLSAPLMPEFDNQRRRFVYAAGSIVLGLSGK